MPCFSVRGFVKLDAEKVVELGILMLLVVLDVLSRHIDRGFVIVNFNILALMLLPIDFQCAVCA